MLSYNSDLGTFSGTESDFDIDALEDFACALEQPGQNTQAVSVAPQTVDLPHRPLHKRPLPSSNLAKVPGNKRSFRDYTKPVKRGFLNRQIPANDPRRFIAQIIANACNTHDRSFLETVLQSFCGPAVVMISRFIGNVDHLPFTNLVLYRELHGVAHMASYLTALFDVVPDGVVRLLDSKVHMFQNGCSYIVGKFTFQGHKCYDLVTCGDIKERRLVPSKFDRRGMHVSPEKSSEGWEHAPSRKRAAEEEEGEGEGEEEGSGLTDLEAWWFEDSEGEGDDALCFPCPSLSSLSSASIAPPADGDGVAAPRAREKGPAAEHMSVALEDSAVDFVAAASAQSATRQVSLGFLGTISLYLDPDAKIFKVEVFKALDRPAGDGATDGMGEGGSARPHRKKRRG